MSARVIVALSDLRIELHVAHITGSDDSSSENSTTMELGEASDSGTSDVVFSPNVDDGTLAQADTVPLSTAVRLNSPAYY